MDDGTTCSLAYLQATQLRRLDSELYLLPWPFSSGKPQNTSSVYLLSLTIIIVSMRVLNILPLAAAAAAFIIPDEQTLNSLSLEEQDAPNSFFDKLPTPQEVWEELEDTFSKTADEVKDRFDQAVDYTFDAAVKFGDNFETAFAGDSWLQSGDLDLDLDLDLLGGHHGHRKPRRPRHPPHHGKPNMTVYELIAKSKYTTKLAAALDEFPDLVKLLNGTKANYTVFAPTDRAFAKIPKHAPKPSKEVLKKILTYHVSPEFFPAGRVLVSRTVPTAFESKDLGGFPQRLSTQVGLRGLTVNFYSRVVAVDIFGTNGVIHGIDSLLIPPPKAVDIISAFPGAFSTLELALVKTGLFPLFNDTSLHEGGTVFAPSNFAFRKLGPRINAFLFSKYGEKYLKALILYHAADNFTLYSDAYYPPEGQHAEAIPKSKFHVDLETGLRDKSLSVDVARFGRLIDMRINGFTRVAVFDGIAADGVIQVINSVLIPPKTPGGPGVAAEDLSVEQLKEHLEPYVEDSFSFEL